MIINYFLSLGTNLGDRAAQLAAARRELAQIGAISATSPIYETAPVGPGTQPFLNQVVQFTSQLNPRELLAALKKIEPKLGRQPRAKWGDREIDLDILLAGDAVLWQADLQIPHAELAHRRFVLAPLADLAPNFLHPVLRLSIATLLKFCPPNTVTKWKN